MAKKKAIRQAANVKVTYVDSYGNPLPPAGTFTSQSGPVEQPPGPPTKSVAK